MALLTTTEAARYLGITQRQLRRLVGHSRITRAVAGPARRDWRFDVEELDRWCAVWHPVRATRLAYLGWPLPEGGYLARAKGAAEAGITPHPLAWTVELRIGYGVYSCRKKEVTCPGPRSAMREVDAHFEANGGWDHVRWQ